MLSLYEVFSSRRLQTWAMVAMLCAAAPLLAVAQTGPGGVGTTDGSSNLQLWLRADKGVTPTTGGSTVTEWINQAGTTTPSNTTISGTPTYQVDELGGRPIIQFGNTDFFEFTGGSLNGLSNGENTVIAVAANTGTPFDPVNQAIVSFGQPSASGQGNQNSIRSLLYYVSTQTANDEVLLAAVSGSPKGSGGDPLSGDLAGSTTYNVAPFSIYSSLTSDGNGNNDEQDLLANGSVLATGDASFDTFGNPFIGFNLAGDVAEVIAIDRQVNAAELTIIYNYLAAKYGISLGGSISDVYDFDTSYDGDVAGVGRSSGPISFAPDGSKQVAQSSGFRVNRESQLNGGGEYLLFGHDGANLAFTNVEPPNGLTSDIQKLAREWRVDLTGQSSVSSITMGFDENVLDESGLANSETLDNSVYNDYFLYVDADGDFSSGATRYDLELQDGLYTTPNANVQIDDGDYVTVARVQRTITFAQSFGNDFEDANGGSGYAVSVTANLNFSNSTTISVPYTVAGVTKTIDGTSTVAPVAGNDFTASAGSFSFPAGNTSDAPTAFSVLNDGADESTTEFIQVGLGDLSSVPVSAGTPTQFEFGIIDDDNGRAVSFAGGNPTSVDEGNGGVKPQTFTLTLPSGQTGPATVLYEVTGTATAGEDYEIASAGTSTATTGEVSFAGSQTATFDINVLTDELDEGDDETFTITLIGATDATLGGPPIPSLTFTINDDDPTPEVTFKSANFTGTEGQSAEVIVELASPAGQDLQVAIKDQKSGTANDGSDYTTFNDLNGDTALVTVLAGETEATASLPILTDGTVEETETINLVIDTGNTDPPVADVNNPPTATVSVLDASGLGKTGPGGVGDANSLALWLRGDEGVPASGSVSEWLDQSGNGNDAAQNDTAEQPTSGTTINGVNVVTFDGADDFLRTNVESLAGGEHTLFSVNQANAAGAVFGIDDSNFDPIRTLEYTSGTNAVASQDGSTTGSIATANPSVLSSEFDGSNISIAVDGGTPVSTGASANSNGVYATVGAEAFNDGDAQQPILGSENAFDGDLGELIAYTTTLNEAQRLIVTNYLAAKYGITSLATDLYVGDSQGGTADRDTDVLGVGQASNGDKHFSAAGGGLELSVAGGIDNGEFVLAGRKIGVEQRLNVSDVGGTVSGLTARLNDDRYLDVTGTLNVDVTFDFGEFGVQGPAGDVSSYVLIRRDTDGTGGWESVSTSASVSGDRVTFANVSLSNADDGYYTIGTTSSDTSPLDARFTAIGGTAGTSGDNTVNGDDAGYLTLGLPVTGGSIGDLVLPDGTQIFDTAALSRDGLRSGFGILYTWDYASQSFGSAITDPTQTLENGRGFYLWVKDTPEVPVDPELNFGLFDLTSEPTGNVAKTVGDASGTFVFLANPYLSAYDMTAFTDLASSGFQTSIASWDPDNGGRYGSYVIKTQGTADDDIARYQGFFLERTATGSGATSFTFDVTGQLDTNVGLVGAGASSLTTAQAQPLTYRRLGLQLETLDADGKTVTRDVAASVFFANRSSAAWDAYDAVKYQPPGRRYATLAPMGASRDGSTIPKSQESVALTPETPLEIPLDLRVRNVSGTFELSARQFENIPADWSVSIRDTKGTADPSDDVTQPLSPSTPTYTFEVTSEAQLTQAAAMAPVLEVPKPVAMQSTASSGARLTLIVEPATPLPVELSGFNAAADAQDVVLTWSTASETNNAGFAIERKTDAGGFEDLGFVEGHGTTQETKQYRYRVSEPGYGEHVFRLRQIDADGTTEISEERRVTVELKEAHAIGPPYPNPTTTEARLDVTVRESQKVRVELFDLLGRRIRVVHDGTIEAQDTETLRVNGSRLASGHYFVRIVGERFAETRRLTIVR